MQRIVIIVLKIKTAGQVRYNKQQLNRLRRAKHVRNTIEMKSYRASILIWVVVMAGHRFVISVWPWHSDVKHPRFLALCIRRTPVLSVEIRVKKYVLYTRKYGSLCDVYSLLLYYLQLLQIFPSCIIYPSRDVYIGIRS